MYVLFSSQSSSPALKKELLSSSTFLSYCYCNRRHFKFQLILCLFETNSFKTKKYVVLCNSFWIHRKAKPSSKSHLRSLPSGTRMKHPINDHLGKTICLISHSNSVMEARPEFNYPAEASNCFNHTTTHFLLTIPLAHWLHPFQIKPPLKRQQLLLLYN